MKGNNSLIFNTATMIEALQEYLNKRMSDFAPKVTGVCLENSSRGTFQITTTDMDADQ